MQTPTAINAKRGLRTGFRLSLSVAAVVWLSACSFGNLNSAQDPARPSPTEPGFNLKDLENIQLGDRHLASDGTFSFQPPANWQIQTVEGLVYETFVQNPQNSDPADLNPPSSEVNDSTSASSVPSNETGNAINNGAKGDLYQANISIFSDTYSGSLADYAAINLSSVSKAFQNFQTISQTEFATNSGLSGVVIVSRSQQLGDQVWQSFYIFDAPNNRKLVITCSALASDADRLAPIFAASIKTLQIE